MKNVILGVYGKYTLLARVKEDTFKVHEYCVANGYDEATDTWCYGAYVQSISGALNIVESKGEDTNRYYEDNDGNYHLALNVELSKDDFELILHRIFSRSYNWLRINTDTPEYAEVAKEEPLLTDRLIKLIQMDSSLEVKVTGVGGEVPCKLTKNRILYGLQRLAQADDWCFVEGNPDMTHDEASKVCQYALFSDEVM